MKNRNILLTLIFLMFSAALLFASGGGGESSGSGGGTADALILYLQRNVSNNGNVMIELATAKKLSSSDFGAEFQNNSKDNLSLFRVQSALLSGNKSQYSEWNVSQNLLGENDTTTNSTTLTIKTTGVFVHENNPTMQRPFTLSVFCTEQEFTSDQSGSNAHYENSNATLNDTSVLPKSGASSTFKKTSEGYELFIPSGQYYVLKRTAYFPKYVRNYDLCINLDEAAPGLEPGFYTATFEVTSTPYYEYEATVNTVRLTKKEMKKVNETITVRGYYGIDPETHEGSYTFTVLSAKDTYTMDLDLQTGSNVTYDVAKMLFSHMYMANSKPSESTRKNRFKLYISPTREYKDAGDYMFIRMNSENQARTDENTVYYDLYLNVGGEDSYKKFSNLGYSPSYSGTIGSAGVYSGNTYYVVPDYDSYWISQESGDIATVYRETWTLEQELYLKVSDKSLGKAHQSGLYYSNVYFTLVADE